MIKSNLFIFVLRFRFNGLRFGVIFRVLSAQGIGVEFTEVVYEFVEGSCYPLTFVDEVFCFLCRAIAQLIGKV